MSAGIGQTKPNSASAQTFEALVEGAGYLHLQAVIDPEHAADIRSRMLARLDLANDLGNGSLVLPGLVEWGEAFTALVTNPQLLAGAHKLLGPDATLAAFSGRILMPGCELGAIHVDWPYWAMEPGMPVDPPLMMQVIWMMEPFTEVNGGTLIVPGSQKWEQPIDPARFNANAIQVTGAAGDAIISHGLLWHRTARNTADHPRVAVLINYSQMTIRPMKAQPVFSDEFRRSAPPALATLLGFDHAESMAKRSPKSS